MSKRVRLTSRGGRRAVEDNTPYPGSVNQPDRKFKTRDEYDNWDEVVNHPLPDMRHEWQDNPRDDIGFGVPKQSTMTVASIRVAANKAVRLAVLLLGEKVGDEALEDQSRDFMGMSPESLDRSLERFAETQTLYEAEDKAEEKKDDEEEKKEASDEPKKTEEEKKEVKAEDDKKEEKKDDEEKKEASDEPKKAEEEKKEEKKDEEKKEASDDKKEVKAEDDKKEEKKEDEEKKEASDESKKADDDEDEDDEEEKKEASDESKKDVKAEDDKDEKKDDEKKEASNDEPKKAEAKEEIVSEEKRGPNELDIELTSSTGDLEPDIEADAQLASLFDDPMAVKAEQEAQIAEGSEKAGIKKLGGQPKVASQGAETADISSIWGTAPDVSQVFE